MHRSSGRTTRRAFQSDSMYRTGAKHGSTRTGSYEHFIFLIDAGVECRVGLGLDLARREHGELVLALSSNAPPGWGLQR